MSRGRRPVDASEMPVSFAAAVVTHLERRVLGTTEVEVLRLAVSRDAKNGDRQWGLRLLISELAVEDPLLTIEDANQ